eukprot:gene2893-3077_t
MIHSFTVLLFIVLVLVLADGLTTSREDALDFIDVTEEKVDLYYYFSPSPNNTIPDDPTSYPTPRPTAKPTTAPIYILPQEQYTFLFNLYNGTRGDAWHENTNWDFSNSTTKNPCMQDWYGLQVLRYSFNGECSLFQIQLSGNNLVGSIPSRVENFTSLFTFDLSKNNITGSLPIFVNSPVNQLDLSENEFTGTIPSSMIEKPAVLTQIDMANNQLYGSIPDWMYLAKALQSLKLDNNHFSGTLKSNISQWTTRIRILTLENNRFHGQIPTTINKLTRLSQFSVDNNYFSGTLTSDMIVATNSFSVQSNNIHGPFPTGYKTSTLSKLILNSNYFTGTLPESFCSSMKSLNQFSLIDNLLTGTVPSCYWGKYPLVVQEFDYNLFHGSINFSSPSLDPNKNVLMYLSFGFNRFSGEYPTRLLSLPRLVAISSPNNCFKGGFSSYNCSNMNEIFRYLDLSGLHSSRHCYNNRNQPQWRRQIDHFGGSFPSCLLFSSLEELSLSGNGFSGSLSPNLTLGIKLNKLNISNNLFSGSLPQSFREHTFHALDISYNKFIGSVENMTGLNNLTSYDLNNGDGVSLKMYYNRLSGNLPNKQRLEGLNHQLNILLGNIFRCNNENSDLPSNDMNYNVYYCKSNILDYASYSYLTAFAFIIIVSICFYSFNKSSFFDIIPSSSIINEYDVSLSHVYSLIERMNQFLLYACIVCVVLIVVLLPIYLGFHVGSGSSDVSTTIYRDTYGWAVSSVYLRGRTIAIVLFVIFSVLSIIGLLVLTPPFWKKKSNGADDRIPLPDHTYQLAAVDGEENYLPTNTNTSNGNNNHTISFYTHMKGLITNNVLKWFDCILLCFILFGVIAVISVGMNIFYINLVNNQIHPSLPHNLPGIQIGIAFYNLFFNRYIIPIIRRYIKEISDTVLSLDALSNYYLLLLITNSIIAPLIATLFQDNSCFEQLFFGPEEKLVVLGYSNCQWTDISPDYKICHQETEFPLPFLYYYQCGAKILSSFLPVWIYYYLLLPIITITYTSLITLLDNMNQRESVSGCMRYLLLVDEIYLLNDSHTHDTAFAPLSPLVQFIDRSEVMSGFVFEVSMLLCYGVNHPITGGGGSGASPSDPTLRNRFESNSFSSLTELKPQSSDVVLGGASDSHVMDERRSRRLNEALKGEMKELFSAWTVLYCCLFFNMIIIFDMVGDEVGFLQGLWVPIAIGGILAIVTVIQIVIRCIVYPSSYTSWCYVLPLVSAKSSISSIPPMDNRLQESVL